MNRLFLVGGTAVFLLVCLFMPHSQTQAQTAVPTPDRLAAPPTVPAPTQADDGAQLYWLHCQPCHGDQGQGLTDAADDEWRAQYPEEDQYCWNSGCHGERPYEDGFILPKQVPAVIGGDSLSKFATASSLHNYIRVSMPFQAPATLADEEYLAIVAFLAEAHDAWDGVPLTAVSAQTVILNTPQPITTAPTPTGVATAVSPTAARSARSQTLWLVGGGLAVLLIIGGATWLKRSR
jgi:mono/diheme cytochrome c family protein